MEPRCYDKTTTHPSEPTQHLQQSARCASHNHKAMIHLHQRPCQSIFVTGVTAKALREQITARSLQTKRRDKPPRVVKFMLFWQNKRHTWKKPDRGVFWSERLKSGHAPPGQEADRVCLSVSILNCNSKCKEGPSQSRLHSLYKNVELNFTCTLDD